MENDILKPKLYFNKDDKPADISMQTFDLPSLIKILKNNFSSTSDDLNAMVLLKSPDKKIVLTVLKNETEISSFQSNGSITFQIIEGQLRFHSRKESLTLGKGQFLTLQEHIKYNLSNEEETVFLSTITSGTLRQTDYKMLWCL